MLAGDGELAEALGGGQILEEHVLGLRFALGAAEGQLLFVLLQALQELAFLATASRKRLLSSSYS
jgi:hypothetical protein